MGREIETIVRVGRTTFEARVLLESEALHVRGGAKGRFLFPFAELTKVTASEDALLFESRDHGAVRIAVGPSAADWASRIMKPKSRVEKLGAKPGLRAILVGGFDEGFAAELAAAGVTIVNPRAAAVDHVFFAASTKAELAKVPALAKKLAPTGGLWIVYPRGKKELGENDVLGGGRAAALKDVKVCKFSETHTALRFVIPKSAR